MTFGQDPALAKPLARNLRQTPDENLGSAFAMISPPTAHWPGTSPGEIVATVLASVFVAWDLVRILVRAFLEKKCSQLLNLTNSTKTLASSFARPMTRALVRPWLGQCLGPWLSLGHGLGQKQWPSTFCSF